jgi:hypothetical protein
MPPGPSLCSYKRACKADLGSPLQSGGRTFWRRENCGRPSENIFIGQNFDWTSASISDLALPVPLPSRPSRSKAYTPLCLFLRSRGSPSPWITCLVCHPPSTEMTVCLWSLIGFRRWPSSQPVRRLSHGRYCQALLRTSLGSLWDTTDHHLRPRQQVPQHLLVESLVSVGHQAHKIHFFPPPNRWPNRGRQSDDCAHPAHVQF